MVDGYKRWWRLFSSDAAGSHKNHDSELVLVLELVLVVVVELVLVLVLELFVEAARGAITSSGTRRLGRLILPSKSLILRAGPSSWLILRESLLFMRAESEFS